MPSLWRKLPLLAVLGSAFWGNSAFSTHPLVQRCVEQTLTYMYSSAYPGLFDTRYRNFYQRHMGLQASPHGNISVPYLSQKALLHDSIFALTSPGSNIRVLGETGLPQSGSYIGRTLNGKGTASLVIIRESPENIGQLPSLLKNIATEPGPPKVILLRDFEAGKNLTTHLAWGKPGQIVEIFSFAKTDTGLNSDTYVATSSGGVIHEIIRVKQMQSQFFGRSYGIGLSDYLEGLPLPHSPPKETPFYFPAPENRPIPIFENAPNFPHRDTSKTFDLGTGNPNIPLAIHTIERRANRTETTQSVHKWYQDFYQTSLSDQSVTFSQGVSSGVTQAFSLLKQGATVAIPSPGYYVYEDVAKLMGLHVVRYNPFSKDLAKDLESLPQIELIMTNFPSNPTGTVLDTSLRKTLKQRAKGGAIVVNDLSYPLATFDGQEPSSLFQDGPIENAIEILGASKELGLPELRVAALVGDPTLIQRIESTPLADAQEISPERMGALKGRMDEVMQDKGQSIRVEMQKRRDLVVSAFEAIGWPKEAIQVPQGGSNILLKLPPGLNPQTLGRSLWQEAGVFVSPNQFVTITSESGETFVRLTLSETSEHLERLKQQLLASPFRYSRITGP